MSTGTPATSSREHAPRTSAELVERIESGWKVFRGAVRDLGRARLAQPIDGGWTYKDMTAHVAAWMEYVPKRVSEIRSGRADPLSWSEAAVDAFNAKAVEERRLVGPEAILDELDTANQRVLDEARRTTDQEIAQSSHSSGILSLFAWCTYLHWEEHMPELASRRSGREDLVERGLDGW